MHRYIVVDAFARAPLEGNPVAVFFDSEDIPADRMQRIAREMNLSEVTFVLPATGDADARIRIFTPVNELPFAGHPLLGTAIALGTRTEADRLRLETRVGTIPFVLERVNGTVVGATMRQPVPTWETFDRGDELLDALGVAASTLPVEIYRNGPRHVFVGLDSVERLSSLRPDLRALAGFPDMATNCFAGSGTRWRCRMFSPAYGVAEDAATGSAAGPLAIHLNRHGQVAAGERIELRQGVEMGRPSLMVARIETEDERVTTVEVYGDGAVFAHGEVLV